MTARTRGKRRAARPARDPYVFQVFVAGSQPNSALAVRNLVRLCNAHIPGRYQIRTIDVLKHADAAIRHNVIVTPTSILVSPLPRVTLFGTLGDPRQVLSALRLAGER